MEVASSLRVDASVLPSRPYLQPRTRSPPRDERGESPSVRRNGPLVGAGECPLTQASSAWLTAALPPRRTSRLTSRTSAAAGRHRPKPWRSSPRAIGRSPEPPRPEASKPFPTPPTCPPVFPP